jgi:hypothetical protein
MADNTRNKNGQPQDPKKEQQKKPLGQDVETSEPGRVGQSQDRNKMGQPQGHKPGQPQGHKPGQGQGQDRQRTGQQSGNKQAKDELADISKGVTDDEIDRDVDEDLDEDERITQRSQKQRDEDKPV